MDERRTRRLGEGLCALEEPLSRERFFEEMTAGYAALTEAERAEDAEEMAAWDSALSDGGCTAHGASCGLDGDLLDAGDRTPLRDGS